MTYANQREYDNATPDDTFTMSFWATINGIDVMGFADVWEEAGAVDEITEVIYENVDIRPILSDAQIADLLEQAQKFYDDKGDDDFHNERDYQ